MPQYRVVTAHHHAHAQTGTTGTPTNINLVGTVHLIPEFDGPAITYPSLGDEFVRPEPITAQLSGGLLRVSGSPLELLVSQDPDANQQWTWRLQYTAVTLGPAGVSLEMPDYVFAIPPGSGPFDISEGGGVVSGGKLITRGLPGVGIAGISQSNGNLVIELDNGTSSSIPIPDAVQGVGVEDATQPDPDHMALQLSDGTITSPVALKQGRQGLPGRDGANVLPTQEAIDQAIAAPGTDIHLASPLNPLSDTRRIRFTSYQKQESENQWNGGEPLWFDTAPLAKNMLTWRLPMNGWSQRTVKGAHAGPFEDSDWQRVVWAGAHWFAQDQPDDADPTVIHGHWSVETPVPSGELHTRFQVFFNDRDDPSKVGSHVALISTNRSDFMIERQTTPGGPAGGRFILAGAQNLDRMVEISRNNDKPESRRWAFGANGSPESGNNSGALFQLRRYSDNGELLGTSINIKRDDGAITLGSDHWPTPQAPTSVLVSPPGGARFGLYVQSRANLDGGFAAIGVRTTQAADTAFSAQAGPGTPRFTVGSDGTLSWGDGGSAEPDARLYRDAWNRLKTDGELIVGSNLRTGAATGAGATRSIAVGNGTPPTSTSASQFSLWSNQGRPAFDTHRGRIMLDPQAAIPDATETEDTQARLNDLLAALRTIGLIES